ncbi:hypothetical protein SMA5143A_5380 [Streptomyces sp. MA5143a]|nr:hypothetical protein SMA5143A_5380 [Streptomyces sp. MA5143a]
MGITRQSVQRVADLLVDRGLTVYVPNPAHRRAKLLTPTPAGRAAVEKIDPGHAALADRLAEALGEEGVRGGRPGPGGPVGRAGGPVRRERGCYGTVDTAPPAISCLRTTIGSLRTFGTFSLYTA